MHVQYAGCATSEFEVERVSIRVTSSIELRAHQDKCRKCAMCKLRAECTTKCKGKYRANSRCLQHDDCHHCPELKWQEFYGRQFRKSAEFDQDQCHVTAPIHSRANACFFHTHSLDDAQQQRFACIVGNWAYLEESIFNTLHLVSKDATDIANQLEKLGFRVYNDKPLENICKDKLEHAIAQWTKSLPENAEALIFLSGHGMILNGRKYFISVDCAARTRQDFVATAQDTCSTLEWIQDRVLGLALRYEILLMSFWDCCSSDALTSEYDQIMRSSGADPLIRNLNKLDCKLRKKTSRSASHLTIFGSASGALAHEEKKGGILAQALIDVAFITS